MPPRVYLTGFMASGKSTVGPLLADRLGYRFVDLDWLVEARTGRTVAALFAEGEAAFRAAETDALRETTAGNGMVVATGGGTLVQPQNLAVVRLSGPVVWLRAAPGVIRQRLGSAASRPMLHADGRALTGDALDARVRDLLAAREPFYAQADLVAEADRPAQAVADEVARALRGWRRPGPS